MKNHLGAILMIIVLAGAGGLVAWRAINHQEQGPRRPGADAAPPNVAVQVAPITSATLRDVRILSGTLEALTRFDVAAKVGGLVESVAVDLGDEVERGQVIAQIDDAEFVQAAAQNEAELAVRRAEQAQAEAELGRADREYGRLKGLFDRGVVSDTELDEAAANRDVQEAAVALAGARVRQAEASLELSRIQLGYTTVRAIWDDGPAKATVGARYQDAGNTVQVGAPIVGVVALDPLRAVVSITERDYTRLHVGQTATLITDAIADRAFEARITRIAPVFREASRQARIELNIDNPDGELKPGMFARVRIVLREEASDAVVPLAAITKRNGAPVVFVLSADRDRVREIPVAVEITDGERVSLRGVGLVGEVVVLGQQMLTDGTAVSVREPASNESAEDDDG